MSLESDDQLSTWSKKMDEANQMRDEALKLLEAGNYAEAADALVSYAITSSEYGEVAGLGCSIIDVAESLEIKNAHREAGKLYLFVANSLRRSQLWGDAITTYKKAAESYSSIDERRFKTAAAACYVGAADCFAQLKLWSDAECMMTLGSILGTGENLIALEKDADTQFRGGDYSKSAEFFGKIAAAYLASLEQLSDLLPRSGLGEVAMETKSILLHRSSENRVAQAVSLLNCGMIPEAQQILSDAAIGFRVALMNLDPLLMVGRPSPSDFKRFSYNLMMSIALYRLLGEDQDAESVFTNLISNKKREVAEKLDAIQHYKLAVKMLKMKGDQVVASMHNVKLGNLENIRREVFRSLELLIKC